MVNEPPSLDQWRTLYDLAAKVYALAPWEYMQETELFGVTDPVTGETNFVSMMGELGEHLAVALYLGEQGLLGFLRLADPSSTGPDPELILETPQLQLSFEDREELTAEDRATIKALGLKFRGRQAWPLFRSTQPGYFPWLLEADEARVLSDALSQLVEVAPRYREGKVSGKKRQSGMLIREPEGQGEAITWRDVNRKLRVPDSPDIRVEVPHELVARVRTIAHTLPRIDVGLEVLTSIGQPGTRPHAAYCLLAVDSKSGFILGQDTFRVETTVEAMLGTVPRRLLTIVLNAGVRPLAANVSSPRLVTVLKPALALIKCEVRQRSYLPQGQRAMESLRSFLQR